MFSSSLVGPFPIPCYDSFWYMFCCLYGNVTWTVPVSPYNEFHSGSCSDVSDNFFEHEFLFMRSMFLTRLLFQYNFVSNLFVGSTSVILVVCGVLLVGIDFF